MRGPYKNQALELIKSRGIPVGTVLDVGVLNETAELMRAFPDKLHVLFEPIVEFGYQIHESYSDIEHELHSVAVSDSSGQIELQVHSLIDGQDISHSMMTGPETNESKEARLVPMIALDDFLAVKSYTEPFLLKIDIDGHELKVIAGALQTLKKCSVVIVECQRSELAQRIIAIQSQGFVLFDLMEPSYYDEAFWQCDAIFVREDLFNSNFESISLENGVSTGKYTIFKDDRIDNL